MGPSRTPNLEIMSNLYRYLAVALAGMVVGWFAGREHLRQQMSSAPTAASTKPATRPSALNEPAIVAHEGPETDVVRVPIKDAPTTLVLENPTLTLTGAAAVMMTVHARNNGTQVVDSVAASFRLTSPGQKIPLAANDHIHFHIQGGLAPGEEKDISVYDLSFGSLRQRQSEHPDAILTVSPTASWGPQPSAPQS
jgi:hypothetical protein